MANTLSLNTNFFNKLAQRQEFLIPLVVIGIVIIMVIPIPPWLMDILLSLNIATAIIILLTTIYTERPLDFSIFPGLLLITTLFRLSLNVSSTRLILATGNPGKVIETFGNFVTMGNIVVGVVIFIILVIIQFIVITKGAGRIAEVAARFTLDAMPGKQMAIDADLNAGLIDEETARKRREEIAREADFYGAMDGASKFVRGDAIAGIIITIINIIGGILIGYFREGGSFADIIEKYTKLTIGDGLVSQIPALLISTSAGIIVSRASSKHDMGQELIKQLFSQSKALMITGGVLFLLGLVPGFPKITFMALGTLLMGVGYISARNTALAPSEEEVKEETKEEEEQEEKIEDFLFVDPMELEIGYALISYVDPAQGGDLLDRITLIRKQIAVDLGFKVPPIRIRDNLDLKPNEYVIKIKGIEVSRAEVMPGYYMAINPGDVQEELEGIPTKDPTFGLDAMWITEAEKSKAEAAGYIVVEVPAVISTHLTEIIKDHAYELLTREDVKQLIENLKKINPAAVEEVIPDLLKIGDIQKVLQNLLWEKVSIRDLSTIIETLGDYAKVTKNTDVLTEYVRHALGRQICTSLLSSDKKLHVITLSPETEKYLEDNLQPDNNQSLRLVLDPDTVARLVENIKKAVENLSMKGYVPVLLVSPVLRLQLKRLLHPYIKNLNVISISEVPSDFEVISEERVSL